MEGDGNCKKNKVDAGMEIEKTQLRWEKDEKERGGGRRCGGRGGGVNDEGKRPSQHEEGVNCPEHKTATGVISRGFFSPLISPLSKYSSSSSSSSVRGKLGHYHL